MKKYKCLTVLFPIVICLAFSGCRGVHIPTLQPMDSADAYHSQATQEQTRPEQPKTEQLVTNRPVKPSFVCLDVSNIMQNPMLPNGCEVVSLAIALKYAGYTIDPVVLYDNYMPKSPYKNGDPWTTYVGDAKNIGYGCYAPCVVKTGNKYLSMLGAKKKVYDVSGRSMSYYKSLIDQGIPVIMWGLIEMNCNSLICWEATVNGKYVDWHSYSHCLVLIGYTNRTYIFCDPLVGIIEYNKKDVETSFAINYKQACIVN